MARLNGEKTQQNSNQAIAEALNTPTGQYLAEVAEHLGISDTDLKERLAAKLDNDDPLDWDVIAPEHQALVEAIARDLESESSVRRLEETKPLPESSQVPLDLPILEEPAEEQPKKRSKRQSTALTKKKKEALKTSDQNSQKLAASDVQVKQALHVRKGQKSGAQLATLELAAEDVTYRKIKGEALVRKVAQLSSELGSESDFNPIELLQEMGVDPNDQIFQDLREQIEPALGKMESATAEIVENAWVNGIDLEVELGNLEKLLNSIDS
jgi:hypothetical protein